MHAFNLDDPQEQKYWKEQSALDKLLNTLRKPQALVIMILVCAVSIVGMQFSTMKHDIANLT